MSKDALIQAILDEHKTDLAKLVADGKMTQAQADAMVSRMQEQVKLMVERTGTGPMWQNQSGQGTEQRADDAAPGRPRWPARVRPPRWRDDGATRERRHPLGLWSQRPGLVVISTGSHQMESPRRSWRTSEGFRVHASVSQAVSLAPGTRSADAERLAGADEVGVRDAAGTGDRAHRRALTGRDLG